MENMLNSIEDVTNKFQDWIIENQSNPILWIGLLVVGLAVFFLTYNALQKEKS